jgi:hypothetical protein
MWKDWIISDRKVVLSIISVLLTFPLGVYFLFWKDSLFTPLFFLTTLYHIVILYEHVLQVRSVKKSGLINQILIESGSMPGEFFQKDSFRGSSGPQVHHKTTYSISRKKLDSLDDFGFGDDDEPRDW